MNILFITIGRLADINTPGIYTDLLRKFRDEGHQVYVVCSREKRLGLPTVYEAEDGIHFLRIKVGNITQCGIIEKGISTLMVEHQYINAIKNNLKQVKFELVLYTTPPITSLKAVEYVKNRDGAVTYLILKDIFPQNAVDIGMMSKTGLEGIIYRYFRRQEIELYHISDRIGCMSQANVDYILRNNPGLDKAKVEVCPNSINPVDMSCTSKERNELRIDYGIPLDKMIFVYGGNLGKPQGIPFIIDTIRACKDNERAFFLIVGSGTEYEQLQKFINIENPSNLKLIQRIPKVDYDKLAGSCDVGLIFLDHRFTIPNFPSRLLSYTEAKIPVLACTDVNTDIGTAIVKGEFGWWCESDNAKNASAMIRMITEISKGEIIDMGEKGYEYLTQSWSTEVVYNIIMKACDYLLDTII